jgi:threonine/homoserine/homoserine lactone efflux protein
VTHTALAFLGVSAVVIVTPGQDTALTIAAAGGIAALLRASEPLFVAVKLCGAA